MCIAIAVFGGKQLEKEVAQQCWLRNDDGAGFAFASKGRVRIFRGYMTFEKFWEAYSKFDLTDVPHLVHFRIKTHGKTDKFNTHPWRLHPKCAMIHNGILKFPADTKHSDTGCFANRVLKRIARGMGVNYIMENDGFHSMVDAVLGTSKMAFIDHLGRLTILNDKAGTWDGEYTKDGKKLFARWFSNDSYKKPRYSGSYYERSSYFGGWQEDSADTIDPIGEWEYVPDSVRYDKWPEKTGWKSDQEVIASGWKKNSDYTWSSPVGFVCRESNNGKKYKCKLYNPNGYGNKDKTKSGSQEDDPLSKQIDRFIKEQGLSPDTMSDDDWFEWMAMKEEIDEELSEMKGSSCEEVMPYQLERDAQACELRKQHIIFNGHGNHYSIRRCDLALELRQQANISWQMIASLSDDQLVSIADEQGCLPFQVEQNFEMIGSHNPNN